MNRLGSSIRLQVISVTILSLLILAVILVTIDYSRQQTLLIESERRVGLTLDRSVNNTINSVRAFIETLGDIAELNTRLAEVVELNANIDFITVTDAEGSVIFHSDSSYQGTRVSELAQLPPDKTILKNVPGFGEVYLTTMIFDSDNLVESPHYQIIAASAVEPIRDQLIDQALSSIWVTLIFALGAASIIIILLQYYFVRPVELLTRASEAIEAGDLTQQVSIKQNNEVGRLALSFNRMTFQLANLINELEERVKRRTHELEIARDQAEQASRAKSDFLSNMSHELRTPLNMVIGYTSSMLTMPQMYDHVPLPEAYRSDIQLIRDSGKHLLTLINDILDLSKVEAGKLVLNFEAVDLNSTFESAILISLGLIGDKPLQLRRNYPDDLPDVWADNVRVRQILLNLLSNAIKYTQTGSVTLFAEVREDDVYIAVTDTGPGIPENALKSIFDRFEQIQNQSEIQGTGLGLDISQKLAQLHGSEIAIQSTMGIGSTFSFTLPISTKERQIQEQTVVNILDNTELFTPDAALQKMCLVIAQEITIRGQLRQTLEAEGTVVVEAHDYQRAIDLAVGLLPDFILLDMDLQEADISQLLYALQHNPETRSIPVVSIENSTNGASAKLENVRGVIHKPIIPDNVIGIVKTLS